MSYERPSFDELVKDALAQTMREISESCCCAGWLNDLEYSLWKALETGDLDYGWGIQQRDLDRLRHLAELARGWWIWSKTEQNIRFVTTDEWKEILAQKEHAEQSDGSSSAERPDTAGSPV